MGDYDNDGDTDWYTAGGEEDNFLFRNEGDGTVTNVAAAAGVEPKGPEVWTEPIAFFDYDRDGWLDLFVGNNYNAEGKGADFLYRNEGDGTFADIAAAAGIERPQATEAAVFGDVDNDGWDDLFAGGARAADFLYRNEGDGTFADIAAVAGIERPAESRIFTALFFDYDNNGNLDLFLPMSSEHANQLYRNDGDGTFTEVAAAAGVAAEELGLLRDGFGDVPRGFAAVSGDLDNDGWVDLVVPHRAGDLAADYLYRNRGDGTFEDIGAQVGPIGNGDDLYASLGDFDGDGFLDLFVNHFNIAAGREKALYRNLGNDNHWLHIELVGIESNRSALGARIRVEAGGLAMTRLLGRNETLVAEFGLGTNEGADLVEVRWPSGRVEQWVDVPGDQVIRLVEGRQGFHRVRPTELVVVPDTVLVGARVTLQATIRPALFEPGARILGVTADLSAMGGPQSVPVEEIGDGAYRLQADLQAPEGNSQRNAVFHVEQETSLGPRPMTLVHAVSVVPAGDRVVFGDELAAPWTLDTSRRLVAASTAAGPVHRGEAALGLEGTGGVWQMVYALERPFSLVGYETLRFAFHPGAAPEGGFLLLQVAGQLVDQPQRSFTLELFKDAWLDPALREWQVVEIGLDALRGVDMAFIRFNGNLEGAFYLDDMRLVASEFSPPVTAVAQTPAVTPSQLALAQNYPNPFNSGTLIRYTLPQPGAASLAVYNLVGQRVALLVDGPRPAGVASVRWDGRDKSGADLASGVYLYRLQVGSKVETRKLLLLR
ncbi:MAG: T9SS type A sorting domain-containing protein [Candidatus Latescibacteria bacterium]|nr:T9SS type A sorting domain-containing protein [Candidatus Latescibacterota bacterium]